jgi:hypothetical protein
MDLQVTGRSEPGLPIYTTQPVKAPCSGHLFRDCNTLVRRDQRLKNPVVFTTYGKLRVSYPDRAYGYSVAVPNGRVRYGICCNCVRRAWRECPDILKVVP